MKYLPTFLDIRNKPCLVVGGGQVALRKTRMLLKAGAEISLVAPDIEADLLTLLEHQGASFKQKPFEPSDLDNQTLVIAATNASDVNQQVSQLAQQQGKLVNVVDQPQLCNFVLPSIVDRSPLIIAISSGGAAPVLARMLRSKLESSIPAAYGKLAELASHYRGPVKRTFDNSDKRRLFWEKTLEGPAAEHVFAGNLDAAEKHIEQQLADPESFENTGEVYLIGAGPGDPDLLTFKALRLMQKADVVLYDRLVSPEILELIRRDAERIYVGKARSNHAVPQQNINQYLVDLAKQGKRVVRLKGGDPFIFGRGGEEIEELSQHGIPFQVVPGITAASGCAAYSGIPLTHRDYAQSVRFVTGHLKDDSCNLPWDELIHANQTVVFYMGLVGLPIITEKLIAHGRSADTPIALIQQGTTVHQKVVTGTLATICEEVARQEIKAPTLLIVGEVVSLQSRLQWFRPE